MRIVLTAIGTQGYAQALFALAAALRSVGHDTLLVMPEGFRAQAARLGLPFLATGASLNRETFRSLVTSQITAENPMVSMQQFLNTTLPALPELFTELRTACEGADLLISVPAQFAGRLVHEATGIPFVSIHTLLIGPISHGPMRDATAPQINAARMRLGFPALPDPLGVDGGSPQLALYPISQLLLRPGANWPPHHHVTGFLFLDEPWTADAGLQAFLEAGEPPVLISFGSMAHHDPDTFTDMLLQAVRGAGCRAIIQQGWSGLADSVVADDIYVCGFVPHSWLMEHVSCVVHHGGAGTTQAALRAGKPSVVVPHLHDQPITAQLLMALGCAGGVVPYSKLTAEALAAALKRTRVLPRYGATARSVGERIRAEKGNETAVARIEELGR